MVRTIITPRRPRGQRVLANAMSEETRDRHRWKYTQRIRVVQDTRVSEQAWLAWCSSESGGPNAEERGPGRDHLLYIARTRNF